MPLTLIPETGAGLANANTFATLVQITTALEASPFGDAWSTVDVAKQDQCIAEASAILTRLNWLGTRTIDGQALAWPRAWMETPDGYAIASNVIPAFVLDATARLAFWLSQLGATPYNGNGLKPGTELALPGGLRLTPDGGFTIPADVLAILRPYLQPTGRVEWGS